MLKVQSYGEPFTVISNNKYTKHMLNILQACLAFCLFHFQYKFYLLVLAKENICFLIMKQTKTCYLLSVYKFFALSKTSLYFCSKKRKSTFKSVFFAKNKLKGKFVSFLNLIFCIKNDINTADYITNYYYIFHLPFTVQEI